MIIDKNGRLFGKLSILDLSIIVIVILAGIGVVYKLGLTKKYITDKRVKIVYTLQINALKEEAIDLVKKDDELYDHFDKEIIGKIINIEKHNYHEYVELSNGEFVAIDTAYAVDQRYILVFEIEADAKYNKDKGYYLTGGKFITAGTTFAPYTHKVSFGDAIVNDVRELK